MSTIRMPADENFDHRVLRALRRRLPTIDILTVQDAGMLGADDPEVLEWAASEGRVLLSGDRATLPECALGRAASGLPMPGVFLVGPQASFPKLMEAIVLIAECGQEGEFEGQINYLLT